MPQASDIVLLPLPFTDLTAGTLRPVLVLDGPRVSGNFLAVQITSQVHHPPQVPIAGADLSLGQLPKISIVRPDKVFTLHDSLVVQRIGQLSRAAFVRVRHAVCQAIGCVS